MESRRGHWTLWLLAAGSLCLVGCRTPTGSEESSSWFNFSSRRGGQGRSSGGGAQPERQPRPTAIERTAETPPTPPPAPVKTAEPAKPTEGPPAPITPPNAPKPTGAPPPAAATGGPEARRLPVGIDAGATPEPRAPAASLGLPSPPAAGRSPRTSPPLEIAVAETARAPGSPATPLMIEPGEGTKALRPGTAVPLPVPVATTGRRPPKATLRLPGLDAAEPATTEHPRFNLPEIVGPSAQRESPTTLRLPAGEVPASGDGLSPRLPLASLDEPTSTKLPASGLTLRSPEAGPARPATTSAPLALPTLAGGDQGREPSERLRLAVGEVEPTPAAAGPGPSGSAGKPTERPDRPLAAARTLPPFEPAGVPTTTGERALRAKAPEAKPTVATVPLPFRLSAWISDEEQHRRWREQQFDRAGAEEKARQAEQERLRQALLRFLVPATPAK